MAGVYEFFCQLHVRALVEASSESGSSRLVISDLELRNFQSVVASVMAAGLSDLQYLRADNNCFSGPLPELCRLESLVKLNLNANPLRSLSDDIGRLIELRELWLNTTGLEALPPALGSLQQLQLLSARGNRISTVPEELVALNNLKWLILDDNEISELPKGFPKFENLVHCNFNKNKISSLCPFGGGLKSLRYFSVAENSIVEISSSFLENTQHIKIIDLTKNPLSTASFQECEVCENVLLDGDSEFEDDDVEDDDDDDDDSDEDSDLDWSETPNSTEVSSSEDEDDRGNNVRVIVVAKVAKITVSTD